MNDKQRFQVTALLGSGVPDWLRTGETYWGIYSPKQPKVNREVVLFRDDAESAEWVLKSSQVTRVDATTASQ